MIILEGNECVFKSTVAEKLSKKLGFPIVKGSSFEFSKCTNEELFDRFGELSKLENVILDRFIYSNRVYATLYDDYAILTDEQREEIEKLIFSKATIYYLVASDDTIKSRIMQRGDDYVDVEMVEKINDLYDSVMDDANIDKVWIDTDMHDSDEIVNFIISDTIL